MNVLHDKRVLYYQRVAFSRLELYASHDWRVMLQNKHHGHLLRRHFVHTFGHNLQTIGCVLVFVIFVANSVAWSDSNLYRIKPDSICIPEWYMYVDTLRVLLVLLNAHEST